MIGHAAIATTVAAALPWLMLARNGTDPPSAFASGDVADVHAAHMSVGARGGHAGSEGLPLAASTDGAETVTEGARCDREAPRREYRVVAVNVDITVNRYLDHDPQGRMYVLEDDLQRVRDEEAQNARARAGDGEPAASLGLQGDAIQPLTLRVNQGECLRIDLRNALDGEAASLHVHGSSLHLADSGAAAVATNAESIAAPGEIVSYEWMVRGDEPEGTHYFHSHGDTREQTVHGLFGAAIVEPAGSRHIDPRTGSDAATGWDAIIQPPSGRSFREFALYYHEIGNENYQLLAKDGQFVPLVDPLTSAYRPDGRALNYRSEPFMNRLRLQDVGGGRFDESVAYSSYSFGDPGTPMMRSYLGDPVKERVIHGGSEVFHVHHVHGGSIRWRRQPGVEDTAFDAGLDKHPQLLPQASERTDSQTIGPSETFDVENECGSGGCQQSVGDFLVHCHVAQHYFAGMWTLWRVYNTLQDGVASTDALPPLRELPGREGGVEPAVRSEALVGTTVDWSGKQSTIDAAGLDALVERQLPPPGVQRGYDASVLDWTRQGLLFLNEPESREVWPGYRPRAPGDRPPILFDPATGRLAYPFLHPHLGKRPPFAPGHGPAPYLDPIAGEGELPAPGANGASSVCPEGTNLKSFAINALSVPVAINKKQNIIDPQGEIFVLRDQVEAVRADSTITEPLAIRANAGEDCVDVLLRNELEDSPLNHGFAKVNAHIHFTQFDVQASDGVIAGFNYEQSVRPFAIEGERLQAAAAGSATRVALTPGGGARFQPGVLVGVGMEQRDTLEIRNVLSVDGDTLVFSRPLQYAHAAGEIVSTEFVRYRWYPDVQFGTAYFHDHVNAVASWKHGLFGALIAEPPGSSYHDPSTGAELASGTIADVHTEARVSHDLQASFRELVLFVQDDVPLTHVARSTGSAFNLRAEPLDERGGDPARLFSSTVHGDPATPVLRAYLGDPLVLRTLVAGTNDTHTVHIDGHWFRTEPYSGTSPPVSTVHVGISERFDLVVPSAGGPQRMAGDYLYYNGRSFKLREGSWGILRVLGAREESLRPLPEHEALSPAAERVCPDNARVRRFAVAAVDVPLPMLNDDTGKVLVLQRDKAALLDGSAVAEPLVLHVNVGDCITIDLTNETRDGSVSLHADMLAFDPRDSAGVEAGGNPPQSVAPGDVRTYTYFAHPEVGETVALLRDWGDVVKNPALGLYGAIIVGPEGATFRDPATGADLSVGSSWKADVYPRDGPAYRDFTLFMQDGDEAIGNHRMPYLAHVSGVVGLNYGVAPLADRLDAHPDPASVFLRDLHGDPETPLMQAYAGDSVKVHVLAPQSEQAQVFSIDGHRWPLEPGRDGTTLVSSAQIGGTAAMTLELEGGAGGPERLTGDFLFGDHREPYRESGLWGVFRVRSPGEAGNGQLRALSEDGDEGATILWIIAAAAALILVGAATVAYRAVRRRA